MRNTAYPRLSSKGNTIIYATHRYIQEEKGKMAFNHILRHIIYPAFRTAITAVASIFLLICLLAETAQALPTSHYTEQSVLASGKWYKISVTDNGIHQISYSQLKNWGFNNPARVRIYGYGGAMLPEILTEKDVDDLPQIPVVHNNNRILFYAQGNISWRYDKGKRQMVHKQNTYSSKGYYFITESDAEAATFGTTPLNSHPSGETVDTYDGYSLHEQELASVSKTGQIFLGEDFRYTQTREFAFSTPGIVNNTLSVEIAFGAKILGGTGTLKLYHNGKLVGSGASWNIAANSDATYEFMKYITPQTTVTSADGDDRFTLTYAAYGTTVNARLDYIRLTYKRALQLYDGAVQFRANNFPDGGTFVIRNFSDNAVVWDITTQYAPTIVNAAISNNEARFSPTENSHEYIAFNPSASFPSPVGEGNVSNQNLHGLETPDMVILTPWQFMPQARQVAALHESIDSMKVQVINHELVFNEFSSGTPDAIAYRRLMKMFYDRSKANPSGRQIGYLLLFGRGFYDNRRISNEIRNCGYPTLLTYQNARSENETYSYTSDDFFTYLEDEATSRNSTNIMSVSVGRFPVKSNEEADIVVEKLYKYVTRPNYGVWRNQAIVIADDGNSGTHMRQADNVVSYWKADKSDLIVNKVYLDAFQENKTATGRTFPEAKAKMLQLLNEGQLVLDYIGHANSVGWTGEDLLNINDIRSMYLKNLPFMITATCDFSRFDSEETSGGEIFFLNEFGGAIALFSSTRVAWINENGHLNNAIAQYLFEKNNKQQYDRIGDIISKAKNFLAYQYIAEPTKYAADSNKLVYSLIGDPAMRLGYPTYQACVTQINGLTIGNDITLQARADISLEGCILTPDGLPADNFYGTAFINLYDAEQITTSNGYDGSAKFDFKERNNKLFSGKANVSGGKFAINFRMPKETSFSNKNGFISLYAYNMDGIEASGSTEMVKIGGSADVADTDTVGPDITYCYLNTGNFNNGDNVNESPILFAAVCDPSGINLSSAGIGHSMTVTLDEKTSFADVSSYYTPDTTGNSGIVCYPLSNLQEGAHTLTFRVWDNEGNSSSTTLNFTVQPGLQPEIFKVYADQNPARTTTNFYIEHDRPDGIVTVTITVYNLMGMPVWQTQKQGRSDLFKTFPIAWDLTTSAGGRVPGGIYLYRATISTDNTHISTRSQKLCVAPSR